MSVNQETYILKYLFLNFMQGSAMIKKKFSEFQKKIKIKVLEDACHALGSSYKYEKNLKLDLASFQIFQLFHYIQ